jgi:hypothetical protein
LVGLALITATLIASYQVFLSAVLSKVIVAIIRYSVLIKSSFLLYDHINVETCCPIFSILPTYFINPIPIGFAGEAGLVKTKGTASLHTTPQSGSVIQALTVSEFAPTLAVATSNLIDPSAWPGTGAVGTQLGPVS